MAISYPITLPTTPGYIGVSIQPRSTVGIYSSPFTMQQQVYAHPGQVWTGNFGLPPMNRAEAAPWVAALTSLNGVEGRFYFGDPSWIAPQGIGTGTPLINGSSQTGYDLITDGWTATQTGIMKAGDWVQIATTSSRTLHMVMADANSDGGGNATLTLWPRVRTAFADNTALIVNSPTGVWRMTGNVPWAISVDQLISGMTVECVEAL
mgnify:CR=1 FL=1|tara:strand:- start:5554 stop:6174 length:621 start_codon:yes stop_codon:yes gene_type:complete